MFRSGMKIASLFLALAFVGLFSSCGAESAATLTSSKVGPTSPGGYFFELTLAPSIIEVDGSASVTTSVWDSNGNPASGVNVTLSGSVEDGAFVTTGTDGIALALLAISGEGSGTGSVTATVENKSVTVSYVVIPQN